MHENYLLRVQRFLYPEANVVILKSSADPEVGRMLQHFNAEGCADLAEDGTVYIHVDDISEVKKMTWLEEGAHMLQFLKHGQVSLSIQDRNEFEAEAMSCLLSRADKFKLTNSERNDCERRRQTYRNNNGR